MVQIPLKEILLHFVSSSHVSLNISMLLESFNALKTFWFLTQEVIGIFILAGQTV